MKIDTSNRNSAIYSSGLLLPNKQQHSRECGASKTRPKPVNNKAMHLIKQRVTYAENSRNIVRARYFYGAACRNLFYSIFRMVINIYYSIKLLIVVFLFFTILVKFIHFIFWSLL